MQNNLSVFIDLNIVLDVLQKREPFYETSARLLALVETGQVKGYIAAHSMTTLFYLIKKNRSGAEARATITNLLQFIKIAPVDQATIEQALNLDYRDYEPAVQMIAAVQAKADCLITRNIKDYQPALLSVLQPVDFLATV
ncbi:MAG: PIN domain-containing protein [Anaerolineales bacterium]|jgi:predicted nucleic acid-binding protein|nr:PIN domain-containing protein [Anaerolineales bacterium]